MPRNDLQGICFENFFKKDLRPYNNFKNLKTNTEPSWHIPGANCTLQPVSAWMPAICSPPFPMTDKKKDKATVLKS